MPGAAADADDLCDDAACGCECFNTQANDAGSHWLHITQGATCNSGPGDPIEDPATYDIWRSMTGSPTRLRTAEVALLGATWIETGSPWTSEVDSNVLTASWYQEHSRNHAAVFPIRSASNESTAGATHVIHYAEPFECIAGGHAGPEGSGTWSASVANGWVRGEAGQWDFSAVGRHEDQLTCTIEEDTACQNFTSAIQWDWTSWAWTQDSTPTAAHYPHYRLAPRGSQRPDENDPNDYLPRQAFSAASAVRRSFDLGEGGPTPITTSVGWLVDGCVDFSSCGCNYRAAVHEHVDTVGAEACWMQDPGGGPAISLEGGVDCIRVLSLHDVLWTPGGTPESTVDRPISKASAIVAPTSSAKLAAAHLRYVLGVAYSTQDVGVVALQAQRGIIWRGINNSDEPAPFIPHTDWCGRTLQSLVLLANLQGVGGQHWDDLVIPPSEFDSGWSPFVVSGQDITDAARVVCLARLERTAAFSVCLQTPLADISGDGVVDGADLGALLGVWGTADIDADLVQNDEPSVVDGADLGALLGSWGEGLVDFDCGATALTSHDIEVVLFATQSLGFESFESLAFTMSTMQAEPAVLLAECIKCVADQIELESGSRP